MQRMFGTDGIRGIANKYLTPELALKIGIAGGRAISNNLAATGKSGVSPKIIIGTDTRRSADMLEAALVSGLCSAGAKVYRTGVLPSPAIAYLIRHYGMDAGVMVSASHNPMQDNGIKFFNAQGYKISDSLEDEIEALHRNTAEIHRPCGADIGFAVQCEHAIDDYVNYLKTTCPRRGADELDQEKHLPLSGLKIALDCANGATYLAAPSLFTALGAEVHVINNAPDGVNINYLCGSTHLEQLQEFVLKNHMDIGLAFDGDGDRMLSVDDQGEPMDGDEIMAICATALKNQGKLTENTVVVTVMSNLGLHLMCKEKDIALLTTAVGDRHVLERMLATGAKLGGEQSGHIIFLEHNSTGDGILTGLQLLSILTDSGAPVKRTSELRRVFTKLPQVLINARVNLKHKYTFMENAKIARAIEEREALMQGRGRVLIRPSGTEPLVRVMIEGQDQAAITQWAEELAALIESELGGE